MHFLMISAHQRHKKCEVGSTLTQNFLQVVILPVVSRLGLPLFDSVPIKDSRLNYV